MEMIFLAVSSFLLAVTAKSEEEISVDSCFHIAGTVQQLNGCFEQRFPGLNSLSSTQWERMLPKGDEIADYQALIKSVLTAKRRHFCNKKMLALYPSIADYIELRRFQRHYCVIFERKVNPETGYFLRSWGYIVIADHKWSRRDLHHSAPHFQSDGNVLNESAAIFERTKSRSLVAAGASRYAVKGANSTCQPSFSPTDCAHNSVTMFQAANAAILEFQSTCTHESCAFVQWHGMAETTCPQCTAFVSAGVDNRTSTIYSDSRIPSVKLAAAFNLEGGAERACTPLMSTCKLVASTNVFGRLVNGVPVEDVCTTVASGATGAFVHVEQRRAARDQWDRWATAIKSAFPARPSYVQPRRRQLTASANRL